MKRANYPEGVDPEDANAVMRALADGAFGNQLAPGPPFQSAGRVPDLDALLAGIVAAMPRASIMFIEGTSIVPEAKTLLYDRSVEPQRDDLWGTVWPRPQGFHVPLTDQNVDDLRALADRLAIPEVCDHITVYDADQILLIAHDVGSEVWLSGDLSDVARQRFHSAVNAT